MSFKDKVKDGNITTVMLNEFKELLEKRVSQTLKEIIIPFKDLAEFDPDLADELLDNPSDTLEVAQCAVRDLDCNANVRFTNLPAIKVVMPFQITSTFVHKFLGLRGIINKTSGIIQDCKAATFECKGCGTIIHVIMLDHRFRTPEKCGCGAKGKFVCVSKEMQDIIKIGIIDDLLSKENKDRAKAEENLCILEGGLATPEFETRLKLGKTVIMNGYLKYVQKTKDGTEHDMHMIVNSVDFVQIGWDNIHISKKDKELIEELAKQPDILDRLAESVADVEGFNIAKRALLMALAGSPDIYDINGNLQSRGTIHTLLVGDPGNAKSYLAKRFSKISPIFVEQSANTASGRGLIAAVSQSMDKDIGAWALYPGVVPMATGGVVFIDEIDKTNEDDYGDHNSAMNDMEVFVAKANIKARLETKTSYIATANPENRVWVSGKSFYNQIDMPKDFLDRFDMIIPFKTSKESVHRDKVMNIMLMRHNNTDNKKWEPEFTHEFITKYIAYGRKKNPKVPAELFPFIKEQLHKLMRPAEGQEEKISFRHLESIMRFAYASARLHLRDITEDDIKNSIDLKRQTFLELEIIDEQGVYNWAKAEDVDIVKISDIKIFNEVINDLFIDKQIEVPVENIIKRCREKGLPEFRVEEFMNKPGFKADYFEPRYGVWKKL